MFMLPREHGAYSQMALPIVTSLVIARAAQPSVFVALAVICGFLAHEPLLVLLGGRGVRARQAMRWHAVIWFGISAVATIAAGIVGLRLTPGAARWSFLLPLIPAAWVGLRLLEGKEKRASAEVAVALAFAFTSVPMCLAAGVSPPIALSVGAVFASVYVAGVLCVRVIVLAKRAGGTPRACRMTRRLLVAVAVASMFGFGVAIARASIPWPMLIAVAPGVVAAVAFAMRSSPPALKSVGWSLALTSAGAALTVIGAVAHLP